MREDYVSVAPVQIVRWLKEDLAAGRRRKLDVRVTREYISEQPSDAKEAGPGDDEEVSVLTTVGLLEVRPLGVEHVWVLRLRVEDMIGPHLPEDGAVPEDPEEIDLDTLYTDFIAPDRGTVFVSAEAPTPQAKRALDRVLGEMINGRHGR